MGAPPVLAGAFQVRSIRVFPPAVAERPAGAPGVVAETAAVAALVSVSGLLASSLKRTCTLIVAPWSASTSV